MPKRAAVILPLHTLADRNIQLVAAAATATVGLATGLAASYSAILFPAINRTRSLTIKQKLALWSAGYDLGLLTIVPLPVIAALGFIAASLSSAAYQGGKHTRSLAAAALGSVGHIAFTVAFMLPTNDRLKRLHGMHKDLSEEQAEEANSLIARWRRLHLARVLSLSLATVAGFKALVDH